MMKLALPPLLLSALLAFGPVCAAGAAVCAAQDHHSCCCGEHESSCGCLSRGDGPATPETAPAQVPPPQAALLPAATAASAAEAAPVRSSGDAARANVADAGDTFVLGCAFRC